MEVLVFAKLVPEGPGSQTQFQRQLLAEDGQAELDPKLLPGTVRALAIPGSQLCQRENPRSLE